MLIAIKKPSGFCSAPKLVSRELFESTQAVNANASEDETISRGKTIFGGLRKKQKNMATISEFERKNLNRKKIHQCGS
ncbi:hypothetical protein EBR21_03215 [bacterium]|nr:hypothetical protein [bacterium]